jgi:putative hydrolase of the HAD superfamily
MATPIRAVTFDFWNTIARVPAGAMNDARQRAVAAACESAEVEVEAGLMLESLEEVGRSWERAWSAGTHLSPREGAEQLLRALGIEGAARELVAEAFLGAGREVGLELAPGIDACLGELGERGVRLGIVCDVGISGGELLRELLAREALLGHFSGWAFSDEVGAYKPSPRMFEAALGALGAEPAESLHVGDLRRTDVAGAAAMGMRTVRYSAMNDEGERDRGPEAEFVIDSHAELPPLVERLGGR